MPGQVQTLNDKEFIQQLAQQAKTQEGGTTKEQFIQAKKQQKMMMEKQVAAKLDAVQHEAATGYYTNANAGFTPKPTKAKKKSGYGVGGNYDGPDWMDNAKKAYPQVSARRSASHPSIEQEMEKIFATTEPMMEISARIMEMKADDGVGQKLGRATANYCGQMMEYFEDEGFSRAESIQLLSSMIRNNSVITGG